MSSYKDYRLSADTSPEADRLLFELLARKSPAEKLQMLSRMSTAVAALTINGLRERHPHESDRQLKIRLAELLYDADIAERIAARLENSQSNE